MGMFGPVLTGGQTGLLLEAANKGRNVGHSHQTAYFLNRFVRFCQQTAGFHPADFLNILGEPDTDCVLKVMREIGGRQTKVIRSQLQ